MTDLENLFNYYDFVQNDLKFMIKSRIRLNILSSITEYPKAMKEIKEENDLSFAAISNNMKRLLEENMVIKIEDKYLISQIGLLKLYSLMDFLKLMSSTKKFEELWLNHDMGGVPDFLLEDLGALKDSELIKANYADIYKTHTNFKELLIKSQDVCGVSSISHPDYMGIFESMLKGDAKVTLIFTKEIVKKVVLSVDFKALSKVILNKNLEIRLYNGEIPVAFTVTEKFMSLGLFNCDGSYDQNRDLISTEKSSIRWGKSLFEYYHQKSEPLTIKNLAKIVM